MQITVRPRRPRPQSPSQCLPVETYVARLIEQATQTEAISEQLYEQRRQAVRDMLAFRDEYHLTLGAGVRIKDLIHEGHKY